MVLLGYRPFGGPDANDSNGVVGVAVDEWPDDRRGAPTTRRWVRDELPLLH
jgi:hypothetical protein